MQTAKIERKLNNYGQISITGQPLVLLGSYKYAKMCFLLSLYNTLSD